MFSENENIRKFWLGCGISAALTQADEFGSELITNAAQLVKYETNADLNDDNT